MVYKRYIKRRVNGKIKKFGPYYYESYRDKDGIARTRYSSQPKKPTKESAVISKKPSATFFKSTSFALILLVLLFVLTSGGFIFANQSTGNFIINFQETGSIISGFTNSFYTFMTSFVADGSKEEPVSEEPPSEELVGDIVGEAPSQEELTEEQPEEAVGEEITVNETTEEPTNETIEEPIVNETITNETIVNETIINETIEEPVSPGDDSSKDTQRGHENLSRGDSAEPSVEPNETITNETIEEPIVNETITNETIVNDTIINETITNETQVPVINDSLITNITEQNVSEMNITIANETISNITGGNLTIDIIQYGAVLGKPVKWEKKIKIDIDPNETLTNLTVTLPNLAGNVSVKKKDYQNNTEEDITESVKTKNEKKIKEKEPVVEITGGVITRFFNFFLGITGRVTEIIEGEDNVTVEITENLSDEDEVIVEYYTDAPYSEEKTSGTRSKSITIVGPDEVHYENVLAFSELPSEVKNSNSIKFYHLVDETFNSINKTTNESSNITITTKVLVNFTAYDTNNNSLIDYLEWVVPHLSNQSYQLIIEITKAEHLDSNRTFISDIYEEVKALDGNWSETIHSNEYVRVTFEVPLDNTRDITLYPRVVSPRDDSSKDDSAEPSGEPNGTPRIEVYEVDKNILIAEFSSLVSNQYNKVYLNDLEGTQDVFDLRVVNGSVEFDHIIDPAPTVTLNAPADDSTTTASSILFNCTVGDDNGISYVSLYGNWSGGWQKMYTDVGGANNVDYLFNISTLSGWANQSDGFSTSAFGATSPYGITTNGSDFWITDSTDSFVYHVNASGDNQTDGFSTSAFGSTSPWGITTNGSDFWILDYFDAFVYHVNASGDNQTDGFSTSASGATDAVSITTNGSDFWFTDIVNKVVYHVDSSGNSKAGGFSTSGFTSGEPWGITTNGSDFWITDPGYVYHVNSSGDDQGDGFSSTGDSRGITTKEVLSYDSSTWGSPTDFWIADRSDDFVYHIESGTGDGTFIWNCLANDTSGNTNWSVSNWTFTVDTTAPTWENNKTNLTASTPQGNLVYFNITLNDTIPGTYVFSWYNGTAWENNSATSYTNGQEVSVTKTININVGDINWTWYFNDTFGNSNQSDVWSVTLTDIAEPTVTLNAPADDSTTTASSILFNCTVGDDNGISYVSLYGNWSGGWQKIYTDVEGANNADYLFDISTLSGWTSESDKFSLGGFSNDDAYGITTNGSDFWTTDYARSIVYHIDAQGNNISDGKGFSTTTLGSGNPRGITTNGSDLWIVHRYDNFVYHVNGSNDNQTDGFEILTALGSSNPYGITTNGSDFWIVDLLDLFVYHVDAQGNNQSDGFSTSAFGSDSPRGITTNGSDFWITDATDDFVYHVDAQGNNQTDGFEIGGFGLDNVQGITTKGVLSYDSSTWGTPNDFWILDITDDFVYHIREGTGEGTFIWNCLAVDTSSNTNWSVSNWTFTVDTTSPTWENNKTNLTASTPNGNQVYFNITLNDTNPGDYVFSWYNGTDWENNSAVSYTDGQEVSVTKIINIDVGDINWTWYFNDTAGNNNQSDVWSVTLIDIYSPSDCTNITNAGVYTLTQDIINSDDPDACINITFSNVLFNCAGYTIDGQDTANTYGIKSEGTSSNKLTNVSIKDCVLTDWWIGDWHRYTENSTLDNITTLSNDYGIYLSAISNSNLIDITVSNNSREGIFLASSHYNQIINSTIKDSKQYGLYFQYSRYNNITSNTIENNSVSGYAGIYIFSSSDPTLNSSFNRIWNNIINNTQGSGRNWKTYGINYTNYFNITKTAGTNIIGGANMGGNYWSDYSGTDTDGDGIGETSYIINDSLMIDYLPLTNNDTSIPAINITTPLNNTFTSNTGLDVNYTVSDTNLDSCWYSNDTMSVNTSLGTTCDNITTVIWSEGQHNVTVWANDTVGNENSSSVTFTIDTTYPTWENNKTNLTASTPQGNLVYFNITLNDTNSGTYIFSWYNGTDWANNSATSWTDGQEIEVTKTINIDTGTINWTWYFNDSAGNSNQSDVWSVTLVFDDQTPPLISIVYPSNNTNTTNTLLDVNYTVSDAGVGVDSCWYSNDTMLLNISLGTICSNITTVTWAEGQHNVTVWANDSSNNQNSSSVTFTIDTQPPYFTNWANQSITNAQSLNYDINAADAGVGLDSFTINWTSTFSIVSSTGVLTNTSALSAGEYYINVSINDTLNNLNSSILLVNVSAGDTTAPNVTINTPLNQTYNTNSIIFNVTATDATGVDICLYTLNNGVINYSMANTTTAVDDYTATNSTMSQGSHTAIFYCNDTINNLNNTESVTFFIDSIFPEINLTNPLNTTYTSVQTTLNYTYTEINSDICWYSLDSGASNTTITCGQNVTGLNSGQGTSIWTVYINDTAGNENSSSVTFFVDSTPPLISIVYPSNNTNWTNTGLDVNYTRSDETSLDSCWYSNDTMSVNTSLGTSCINITTVTWSEGQHNVTVWANDTANNENSSSVTFIVDTTPPYFTNWANQSITNAQSLNYDINAADAGVGLDSFAINWTSTFSIVASTGVLTNTSALSIGEYYINVSINDTLGNLNSSILLVNVGANHAPNISLNAPENGSVIPTQNWTLLNATVTDPDDNNMTAYIYANNNSNGLNLSEGLVYIGQNIANGSEVIYNLTALPIKPSENDLVFLYHFDNLSEFGENDSLVYDFSGNGNNGTVNGGALWNVSGGKFAGAFEYDGINDWLEIPEAIDMQVDENWSVMLRFKLYTLPSSTDDMYLFKYTNSGSSGNTYLYVDNDDIIKAYDGAKKSTGITVSLNTWYYVASVRNGSTNYSIYVNGESKFSGSFTFATTGTSYEIFNIDQRAWGNGTVDEVAVFNRSLSASEILDYYRLREGKYYWKGNVSDGSLSNESDVWEFTIGPGIPTISIVYPQNTTYNVNVSELNYTFTEASPDSCWYSTDGGATNSSRVNCGANFTNVVSNEGSNTWTVYINNTAGNEGSNSVIFFKDTTYPTWENNKTNLTESTPLSDTVYFNITLNDTNPGDYIFSWYNGTAWENNSAVSYTNGQGVQVTKTINIDTGTINWTWYFNDTAGNNNQSDVWSVTLTADDTTAPSISINTPLNQTYNTNSIIFNVTATDATGVDACLYSLNNGITNYSMANTTTAVNDYTATNSTMSQGSHTTIFYCNDTINNLNNTESVTFFIDSIFPDISIVYPSNNTNTTNTLLDVNYTVSDSSLDSCWYSNDTMSVNTSLGTNCINITSVTWAEGQHNVTVWANDSSNNQNSSSVTFTIDTIPPYFTNWANQSLSAGESLNYDINAADAGVGLDSFAINWTSTFSIVSSTGVLTNTSALSAGEYYINVSINDTLNNLNSSILLVNVSAGDTTAPNVTINTPLNQTYNTNSIIFNVTATDATGVDICLYTLNNGVINYSMANTTTAVDDYTATNSTMSQGSHTAIFYCNDTINNLNNTESVTFFIDSIFPEINLTNPLNTTYTSVQTTLNYTYTEINSDTCWYSLDSGASNTTITCGQNVTGLNSGQGSSTWTVYINDTAGNENSSSVTFFVDSTAPSISIVYPSNNTNTTNTLLDVNYTATDETSLDSCWYSNDTMLLNISLGTTCSNITTVTWAEGQHNVTVWANDSSNNQNSSSVTFIVDTTPPYFTNWADQTLSAGQSLNYDINAADDGVGLDSFAINWTSTFSIVSSTGVLTNTSALSVGEYYINVSINDTLNNLNSSILLVNVSAGDTTPPAINFTDPTPSDNTVQSATAVYVNVSTSDASNHSAFIDWNRSLVGWWKMDEYNASGIFDNSTWSNFGKFNGGQSTSDITDAKRGKGLDFDGINDYVSISANSVFDNNESGTYSAWVYSYGTGSGDFYRVGVLQQEIDSNNLLWLGSGSTNNYVFLLKIGGVQESAGGTTILGTNQWYYLVGTYNSTNICAYLNGVLDNCVSRSVTKITGADVLMSPAGSYFERFNGSIDEAMIFNRVLTPEEINSSYNAGTYRLFNNFTGLADGNYNYTAHVIDVAGNTNQTEQRTVTIDTTPPTWENNKTNLTASTPQGNQVYFNITLNDTNPGDYIFSWYNGTDWENNSAASYTDGQEIEVTKTINIDTGDINWTWYFNDSAGNSNQSDVWSVTLVFDDQTAPLISIVYPENNTFSSNTGLDVNYTVSDAGVGVDSCWHSNDSMSVNISLGTSCINITTVTWTEGQHNVTVWANDSNGYENSSSVTFTIDTTAPSITLNKPDNNSFTTLNWSLLNATVYDNLQNMTVYFYANNNSNGPNMSEGLVYIQENVANGSGVIYNLTALPVKPSESGLIALWHFDNLSEFGENNTNIYDFAGGDNNLTCGINCPISYNKSGGKFAGAYNFSILDNQALTTTMNELNGSSAFSVMLWVKPNVADAGLCVILGKGSWGSKQTPHIRNTGGSDNLTIVIDTSDGSDCNFQTSTELTVDDWTHLVVTWNGSDSYVYFNGVQDSESCTGTGSFLENATNLQIGRGNIGDSSCNEMIDEVAIYNRSLSAAEILDHYRLAEGKYYWKGNVSDGSLSDESEVWEFSVDTTSPTWENNKTNLTASTPNGNQVYFNITLNDTNPGDYVFSWYNGTDWENNSAVSYTDGQEVSVTKIINIDVGDINWTWYFNDTAGNNNQSDVWSVTLVFDDQTPPLISIVYPSNNTFSSNTGLNVNYTVSDAGVGVDSCWYSNDSMSVNITLASCINITAITWAEGQHNVTVWANDSAGNENSSSITFTIDTIVPAINFTDPTPPNASSQSATSVYVNVSTSDASNHSAFIDWNYTLRGWWNFESVLSNGTVYDNSTHCYDNETEILTNEGWKYFFELDKTEEVATLNQETMELEYQMPLEYQEFDYNNDMYKIILEDGSDLLVSEDHKVYTGEENQVLNNFLKSFVLNISTEDCFLNLGSLDQIAQFNFNASANIGMSLLCVNSLALDSNCLNNFLGIISTKFDNSINASLNCSELSLEYFNISDSFFFNSSVTYSGVDNFIPKTSEFIMINLTGLSLKKDSSILESTTNCIFYQPSFLYRFHTPSLTLSPSLKQSSSVNSEFSSILSNFLSNNALLTFSDKNLRMDSERFSSGSSSICFFNSSGIDKVMFGILTHSNSVYSVKDVQVYKSFGLEDFSLKPIKEVYSEFNNNNEIYFLDSENNPIKVKSITKEKYDGKIYDVDVENDIVLVRRENEKGIWSGNSNHGTLYNHATNTTVTGARGQAIDFDGVDDYVDVGNPSSLQITGNLTISAWIKTTDTSVSRIVSKDDVATNRDYLLQYSVSASEKVRFGIFKSNTFYSSGESTTLVSDGSWHYIVGINNGTDLMIYVDGVLENSASNGGTIDNDAVNLEIGRVGGGDDEYFNGTIDEVMIFNRVLSPEEINASYNAGSYRLFSNFTGLSDGNYNYTAHVIDALGYTNQTEQRIITIDTTYPTWENNKTNLTASTSQGQQVYFNITLNDTNPGYYIFSWYNGTAWENNSATSYTNGQEVSVTKTINIDTGDINWTWYFNDTAGNSNQSDVWSVTLVFDDQTPPSISIVYPSNNTNTTNTLLDVNYTVSDSSLDSCWYSNDTMSINTSLGTSCNNITTITWSEGQHNVTVWANDSNNNEGSDSVTFTIDTTLPVISIVYPQNTTYNVNVSELNYTFTEASPDSCWYSTDGGATNSSRVNCGANFTNAVSNEGSNTWTIYINDTAGNENSTSVTFFKDTIYPGISILYPSNNTNTTNTLLDVNYTYTETSPDSCWWTSDAGATNNSLTDCTTNITGEAWSEGSNTIIVYINDTANNENSSSVTFTIDTQPPYFTNWANQTLSAGQSLNYDINAADDGVGLDSFAINWTSTFSIVSSTGVLTNTSALSVGEYYINVSINDTLGNLNSSILLVNVSAGDTTPPDINFTNPTPSDNTVQSATAVYVNVSTSDASNHSAFIDWNRSLIGWWKFDEYNASGIYDNSTWNNFGTFNGGLSTSDIVTGKRGKGLDFDGIDDYVSVSDDASLDINNFTISMWIYPKDSSPSQTYSYLLVKGEDWLSEWSYAVRFDDGTYSDLEMVLSSSGTSATENLAPISSVISNEWQYITFTFNGSTVVSYYNGIKQSTSLWSNSIYKGTGRVTMGARWDSSVGSSLYHLNGTIDEVMIFSRALSPEEINASYNAGAYRLFNNFTGLAEGNYNYTAHVIDALGYTNQTEQRTVTIDTTPPTWENNKTNLTASTPQGNLVYFNITLNDTNPGTYIFSWYNGTAWENNSATSYTNGQEVQVTKTITADTGDINWTWYFNDSAGNSNQSDVWGVTLTIDNAYVPEINLTAPQNASIISSESVLLNATVTDGDNDNMTVYLFANNNSNGLNFSEGLVYMQYNVPNGTDINYNLTALPVKPSEDSLVGLWHLDNLSEFGECTVRNQADCVYDFSGNGNNGTLGNATSGTDPTFNLTGGKFAGAFEFDGVDDYVGLGRPSSLNDLPTANFTISAWVYVDSSISSWDSIFGCYQASGAFGVPDGWNFRMTTNSSGDRSLVFDAYHTTTSAFFYSSYGVINDNQWHHVVAVWDASSKNATLYVDGSETSYSSRTPGEGTYNTDSGVGNDKEIGRIPHAGGVQFFDGAIDDVAIYNRALNATEILDHYRLKNGKYFWKGNVSDGTYTNQSDVWEFNITGTPSWAVLLSPNLSFGAWWNVTTLPVIDLDAIGNNDSNGKTTYWVNISATNTLVDVYLKASGNLITAGGIDVLGLGNESYAYSSINNTLVNATNVTMTTSYSSIGKSLGDGSVIYLKFFLDVPGGQPAGWYNNTFDIRTVQEGGSP